MIYKHRHQPSELPILGSLHTRMNLSSENKKYYYSLKKDGKVNFYLIHLPKNLRVIALSSMICFSLQTTPPFKSIH
ncbi:hypothetical protein MACH08_37940 [Oceanobacillus kimchii]|uniref:Uncharacterized protein n=1 Tax=Oceanobacillus kimchii TaxID=746691 RepID=A0ABQ5TPH3_9BACI|nr:hypothetical protein MACH08_37940 [Oceanobacillus kimchii]